jgi:hydroxymethylpyrimidine pyrophosphatase-like HAD family hydrolase
VITALSALLAIPTAQIATIGDMPNDVLMFERRPEHRYGQREAQVQRRAKL